MANGGRGEGAGQVVVTKWDEVPNLPNLPHLPNLVPCDLNACMRVCVCYVLEAFISRMQVVTKKVRQGSALSRISLWIRDLRCRTCRVAMVRQRFGRLLNVRHFVEHRDAIEFALASLLASKLDPATVHEVECLVDVTPREHPHLGRQ
jgi:hypothetical protein